MNAKSKNEEKIKSLLTAVARTSCHICSCFSSARRHVDSTEICHDLYCGSKYVQNHWRRLVSRNSWFLPARWLGQNLPRLVLRLKTMSKIICGDWSPGSLAFYRHVDSDRTCHDLYGGSLDKNMVSTSADRKRQGHVWFESRTARGHVDRARICHEGL